MRFLGRVPPKVLVVGLVCVSCTAKSPRRHYEKTGGFSYDPPEAWQVVEFPGLKYRISHGPRQNEFAPNIVVVDEAFSGPLADYVDASLENMKKGFVGLTILKREDFQTEDAQTAVRVITEAQQQGRRLRQTYCFFGEGSRKHVASCSTLAEGGEALDGVFEKSMKTFRIH